MILKCPSCQTRYLVQIGLFASGGRQVRCARCKHAWHATLPTHIDVFTPPEPALMPPPADAPVPPATNLPALVNEQKRKWRNYTYKAVGGMLLLCLLLAFPLLGRRQIVRAFPQGQGFYQMLGLDIDESSSGLVITDVKPELRYDSGMMRLFVDGVIHNPTSETQFIPDIKAHALGPDKAVIQSWLVEAPAATIAAGSDIPFHTEVNAPMKRTIEDVKLEFYAQDEKPDAAH